MITRLTEDALQAVAALYVDGWQQTYQNLVPQTYLDSLTIGDAYKKWALFLQHPTEKTSIYGSYDQNGTLVGFIAIRVVMPDQGEVYALYLDPIAKGKGLGKQLIHQAMIELKAQGCQEMLIWVMKANQPAVQFYQHLGGQLAYHRMSELDGVAVEDEAYRWDL